MRQKGYMRDTLHITIKEQLLMFLHTMGHNQHNRVITHNFLRSSDTASGYFKHVLHANGKLCHKYVHQPSTQTLSLKVDTIPLLQGIDKLSICIEFCMS